MNNPPVPPDLDLRGFQYMPLDVVRLIDSDLNALASGDEFKAAVILWCKSWHQVPAASLPDDDKLLSHLAGFGRDLKAWRKVKDVALRGFEKCSDGRLYHHVIAEKALEAGEAKRKQRERTAAATEAKKRKPQRNDDRNGADDEQRNDDREAQRNGHQGKGEEGKGEEGKGDNSALTSAKDARAEGPEIREGDPAHWASSQAIIADHERDVDDWELEFLHSIKWATTITKAQSEKLKAIQHKVSGAKKPAVAVPPPVAVIEGTPQWDAWLKHNGKRPPTTDINTPGQQIKRGWYFPSEFPPS